MKYQSENDEILNVQTGELSEVAELRGDGASELIRAEIPVNEMLLVTYND